MSELASTNSSSPGTTPVNHRKERGAIAAQACETCRSRKQRCDEQRPKCSTCQKFKLECRYREPQPTKKDKTLVEILDRLKSLEGKIDSISIRNVAPSSNVYPPVPTAVDSVNSISNARTSRQSSLQSPLRISDPPSPVAPLIGSSYRYVSAAHKLLAWPAIQQTLESLQQRVPFLNPVTIEQEGASVLLGLQPAQLNGFVDGSNEPRVLVPPKLPGPTGSMGLEMSAPSLSWETMQRLSKSYFDTFNFLYPLLDRHMFISQTLPTVVSSSFSEHITSTLAYLVFALGEVAMSSNHSDGATNSRDGRPSGVKGGTVDRPPGLAFFNEARKRMGFNLTECSLENIQVYALAALYYATCFHHAEFWRMSISASLACQALLSCNPGELASSRADLVKRAYWLCSIMETSLHMELDLPLTGLDKFEEMVGLPNFNTGSFSEDDYIGNQASHYQENFLSQIVLRRLSAEFHSTLGNAAGASAVPFSGISPTMSGTLPSTIKQLANQLDQWRGLLPEYLRWEEKGSSAGAGDMAAMPVSQVMFNSTTGEIFQQQPAFLFSSNLDGPPQNPYPYAIDIQVALLRTRYYWTRYLIYRPFVYKALHHPEQMTQDDAAGAAECLRSALKWPVTMVPPARNKRLIPYPFFWSQNLLVILILLHMSQQHNLLSQVRTSLLGEVFNAEASETVTLYLHWLRDLRTVDPAASWCWEIARLLYGVDD